MYNKSWKRRNVTLTKPELAVLDQLLEVYPEYAMVDDYSAVKKLLERKMVEAGERKYGSAKQAVYRITTAGAQCYGTIGAVAPLERVG